MKLPEINPSLNNSQVLQGKGGITPRKIFDPEITDHLEADFICFNNMTFGLNRELIVTIDQDEIVESNWRFLNFLKILKEQRLL